MPQSLDTLKNNLARWGVQNPALYAALRGALPGLAAGAVGGALGADEGDRVEGALTSGMTGAVLGAIPGGLMGAAMPDVVRRQVAAGRLPQLREAIKRQRAGMAQAYPSLGQQVIPLDAARGAREAMKALHAAEDTRRLLQSVQPDVYGMDAALGPALLMQKLQPVASGVGGYVRASRMSEDKRAKKHAKKGEKTAAEKQAGTVDRDALLAFARQLRHGDIVNFDANTADVFENSLRRGIEHGLISKPIQALSGSPEHHTAMYAGIHPKTREPMLLHNYEQGGTSGLRYEPMANYADRTFFAGYRMPGVSDEDAAKALAQGMKAWRTGGTEYSIRNLAASVFPVVGNRLEDAAAGVVGPRAAASLRAGAEALAPVDRLIGQHCDPGTGICSYLPVETYARSMGKKDALRALTGRDVPLDRAPWSVAPGDIRKNLAQVGSYAPGNSAGSGVRGALTGIARRIGRAIHR